MDILKLLPLLFVAAQGEARAIHHQQLLPAIPGYVPVYIQQGPDVQVIYETGRKVAVQDSGSDAKPAEEKPEEVAAPEKAEESQQEEEPKESEQQPPQEQPAEQPPEPTKAEVIKEQEVEDKKPAAEEHKPEPEEQNNVNPNVSSSSAKTGSGSAVLVPGYLTSEAAEK